MRPLPRRLLRQSVALGLTLVVATCTDNTGPGEDRRPSLFVTPTGLETPNPPQIFVGAGDIATCSKNNDEATAKLVDDIPGTVFVLGDDAYERGSATEYTNCYEPTWGRHKARTKPVPGNHDYETSGGSGYFNYFGAAAGTPGQGYYSYDLGAWHIIAINSEISVNANSAQMQWLRADLAAHGNLCTLAYWHEPLYSSTSGSGSGGRVYTGVRPLWDTLYAYGADLILNGHRHVYERIGPIEPNGSQNSSTGIRTIIAGTGGIGHGNLDNAFPASEVRNGNTYGVLKLYLYDDSYASKFIPIAGQTFTDSSSAACHLPPGQQDPPVPTSLDFVQQPTSAPAGAAITPSVTVEIQDQFGARMTGATNSVTLDIGTNPGSGALGGTTTRAAVNGLATFPGLSIDKVGTGYTLTAGSSGLQGATSSAFNITELPVATSVAFVQQPTTSQAGASITPSVTVEIQDQFGNRMTGATNSVTLDIGTNPGSGTLGGTTTQAAVNGLATFPALSINNAGTGYRLTASSSGLQGATSSAFNITEVAVATALAFVQQPTNTNAGASISPSVTVEIQNQFGARMTGATDNVTLEILNNPGSGTLGGTTTHAAVNGLATFSNLSINNPGTGYTLRATSGSLTGVTSSGFDITTAPPPGITHTPLTAGTDLVNKNIYTTASISPAPNTLVTIAVMSHRSKATISPTVSGGGMSSWTLVTSVDFDTLSLPHRRLSIYRAMSASPGSGPITFTYSAQVSNVEWMVSQWGGVDISGANGAGAIVQTGSASADAASGLSVPLASFGNANNVAFGAFGVRSSVATITPGTGFTEIDEQPATEGTKGDLETEWAVNRATIDATWTDLNGGALGVEIKATP